jgi:curved DNA-binding protein CbpA
MDNEPLPDHYRALGLDKTADASTIKATYRKLVLKCHPDKVTDPALKEQKEEEFHQIQQAYEVLIDDKKRGQYEAEITLQALRREKLARGGTTREKSARFEFRTAGPADAESKKTRSKRQYDRTRAPPSSRKLEQQSWEPDAYFEARRPTLKSPSRSGLKGVLGYIGPHKVTALCDTGAHENCIRKQFAMDLKLKVRKLEPDEPRSFVMGHGKQVQVLGAVQKKWKFAADSECVDITLYVLSDCIFDVILGQDFLYNTQTITEKTYRLSPMERPQNALKIRLVNLCGTPVRCMRGTLDSTECSALPDSGAEPNLVAYDYAEAKGWLADMYPGPESCRLLQFADGSTESVSGRLRLQWSFLTGWGTAKPEGASYHEFDVLRGCPFDVILGCDFLDDTEAFTNHVDSMHEVVRSTQSGMNIVVWVKSKLRKGANTSKLVSPDDRERERAAEFQRLGKAEWPSDATRWYPHWDPRPGNPNTSPTSRSTTAARRPHRHLDPRKSSDSSPSSLSTTSTGSSASQRLQTSTSTVSSGT